MSIENMVLVAVAFVVFGTLSYTLTGWKSAESAPDGGEDESLSSSDLPDVLFGLDNSCSIVSGSLPVSNGGFDIAQYPENCPDCEGSCEFGPVPMSIDDRSLDYDQTPEEEAAANEFINRVIASRPKPKKKAKKKPAKKTKKVKSLLEQMFEDAPKDKKSKKKSKK